MEDNFDVIRDCKVTYGTETISKTFLWMFFGLLVTGIVSYITYSSGLFVSIITGGAFSVLMIAEIAVVLIFSQCFRKLSPTVVSILYFLYAIINGLSMSVIFALFEMQSIFLTFGIAAGIFGLMAWYGYKTQTDLSRFSSMFFGFLTAGIILSIVNLFLGNSSLDIAISWVVSIVFFGITAYDIQKIKVLDEYDVMDKEKLHIYGAMEIYLDFINIFLRLLSLFGRRRD